jgi:hypothetical protein
MCILEWHPALERRGKYISTREGKEALIESISGDLGRTHNTLKVIENNMVRESTGNPDQVILWKVSCGEERVKNLFLRRRAFCRHSQISYREL